MPGLPEKRGAGGAQVSICWKSCGGLGGNARFTMVSRGVSPESGAQDMTSDMPAKEAGKSLCRFAGVALETQHYPDSPNRPDFPTAVLRPGETFRSVTEYRFKVR